MPTPGRLEYAEALPRIVAADFLLEPKQVVVITSGDPNVGRILRGRVGSRDGKTTAVERNAHRQPIRGKASLLRQILHRQFRCSYYTTRGHLKVDVMAARRPVSCDWRAAVMISKTCRACSGVANRSRPVARHSAANAAPNCQT